MPNKLASLEDQWNMVGTCCPNCGRSYDFHDPNTGECPETSEYEPEELAALAVACHGLNGAHVRIAMLLTTAETLRRLKRMEN